MPHFMPEFVAIGTYDVSINYKNRISTPPRKVLLFEFEIALEDGGMSYFGDKEYEIKKGNVICAKPGQIRHTHMPYKCFFIHVLITDEKLSNLISAAPDLFVPQKPKEYFKLFSDIIDDYTASSFDHRELSLQSRFFKLLSKIMEENRFNTTLSDMKTRNVNVIKDALDYIDLHFTKSITLSDIASHVNMSKIYFHNIFIAATGTTTHKYILEKRISLAKKMLITNQKSFSEIAFDCGFSSQPYFNSVFKRETGKSPGEFVKQMGEKYGGRKNYKKF